MYGELRPRAVTVRVLVHLTSDAFYAVGVVASEWQGAVKVSRRLAQLRPMAEPIGRPLGVDLDVWRAYCALEDLVNEQRTDGGLAG